MQLKAVLFDLDGTLMDSVSVILDSNRLVCAEMDLPYDEAALRSWIGIPLDVQAGMLAPGREREYVECYRRIYLADLDRTIRLFPDTLFMLDAIRSRGYRTGLVTSKGLVGTTRCVHQSGMAGKFDVIITCDDVVNPKPHPEPIRTALRKLDLLPDQSVYVGDSFYDCECAGGAGVKMVGMSWGAKTKDELASRCGGDVFDSWHEFLARLD